MAVPSVLHYASRIRWFNLMILTVTPILGVYGMFNTPLQWQTLLWSIFMGFITNLGEYTTSRRISVADCSSQESLPVRQGDNLTY